MLNAKSHPVFLEKRVYQGSSGAVYPYPTSFRLLQSSGEACGGYFQIQEHARADFLHGNSGDIAQAQTCYAQAARACPDRCFPNRMEEVNILQDAMKVNPTDAKAPYYPGNFWYNSRQYAEAVACWEKSAGMIGTFSMELGQLY
ncbi:hypothetical protein Barb4_03833 [Bacteroidales bacterium Barb4]|nr:hypothetical protein Barb4_03833 [Bacteroidales bacterium Barb4]